MEVIKSKSVKTAVLMDIKCDHCGCSCRSLNAPDFGYEFMELKASWGYGSKKDFEMWTAHLCEPCVDKLFNNPDNKGSIKINFNIQDLIVGSTKQLLKK